MAFEDVAKRMAKRHESALSPTLESAPPLGGQSGAATGLWIAAGLLIALGSGMVGLFMARDRMMRRLAILGVLLGIGLVVRAMRRD